MPTCEQKESLSCKKAQGNSNRLGKGEMMGDDSQTKSLPCTAGGAASEGKKDWNAGKRGQHSSKIVRYVGITKTDLYGGWRGISPNKYKRAEQKPSEKTVSMFVIGNGSGRFGWQKTQFGSRKSWMKEEREDATKGNPENGVEASKQIIHLPRSRCEKRGEQ